MSKTTRKRSRRANVTIDENTILPDILRKLKELVKIEAHIGVEGNGETAMIAGIHEYGSIKAGIPARSFIGSGKKKSTAAVSKLAKAGIQQVVEGNMQALDLIKNLGEVAKEKTLKNFDKIREPALSPIYAKRKNGNKILQDEEKLRSAITTIIVPKGR